MPTRSTAERNRFTAKELQIGGVVDKNERRLEKKRSREANRGGEKAERTEEEKRQSSRTKA